MPTMPTFRDLFPKEDDFANMSSHAYLAYLHSRGLSRAGWTYNDKEMDAQRREYGEINEEMKSRKLGGEIPKDLMQSLSPESQIFLLLFERFVKAQELMACTEYVNAQRNMRNKTESNRIAREAYELEKKKYADYKSKERNESRQSLSFWGCTDTASGPFSRWDDV